MIRWAFAASLLIAVPAVAAPVDDLRLLRSYDMRLAAIAWRLTTANAALCTDIAPGTGIVLHGIDQYGPRMRPAARALFGFEAPVAVEGVVADTPGARSGVAPGDSLVAVAGTPIIGSGTATAARDAAHAAIDSQPASGPLRLTLLRDGERREVKVAAVPACRSAFEVLVGTGEQAQADGEIVQVGVAFLENLDDPQLAAIVAHELSHNILRHRVRVAEAGGKTGLASEFGRSARLSRIVEDEADRLSVHLLHNAGYDPAAAAAFWRSQGADLLGGLLRGGSHASAKDRAKLIEIEITTLPEKGPSRPDLLIQRDAALPR